MAENKNERSVEKRRFLRVECQLSAAFLLEGETDWIDAEVLDLSIAGVKLRFRQRQGGRTLSEADIEWQGARFRFTLDREFFYLDGCFLKVYVKEGGSFTAGVEFLNAEPEDQFKLVALYAEFRNRPT
ncbi:MAG: PilZ domain-containing protein [Fretibacterium sp.]|nr:PilZ domain-containing protein [Fretibacterium sp.]